MSFEEAEKLGKSAKNALYTGLGFAIVSVSVAGEAIDQLAERHFTNSVSELAIGGVLAVMAKRNFSDSLEQSREHGVVQAEAMREFDS